MRRETLFTLETPYRQSFDVEGFRFGKGEKSAAIVGSMRGNEVQQLYCCCRLVQELKRMEQQGLINNGHEILVVPCINHFSMNVGSRFWPMDNTDINRMFPGYNLGETTQRIAASLFEAVQGYQYGIQFSSFYLQGDFVPHVRMNDMGYQAPGLCNLFGLPYVSLHKPEPFDTTTLGYNWQVWESSSFSIYTRQTDTIDEDDAHEAVVAVLRFLSRTGVLKYNCHNGYMPVVLKEGDLAPVLSGCGGLFVRHKKPGDSVEYGDMMAEILDPITGEVKEQVLAPVSGVVFFGASKPLITEHTVAFKIVKRLHA